MPGYAQRDWGVRNMRLRGLRGNWPLARQPDATAWTLCGARTPPPISHVHPKNRRRPHVHLWGPRSRRAPHRFTNLWTRANEPAWGTPAARAPKSLDFRAPRRCNDAPSAPKPATVTNITCPHAISAPNPPRPTRNPSGIVLSCVWEVRTKPLVLLANLRLGPKGLRVGLRCEQREELAPDDKPAGSETGKDPTRPTAWVGGNGLKGHGYQTRYRH